MIGVFDSGAGGLFALAELRRLSPTADIAFFADTENAPYGNKSREKLIELVSRDIDRLVDFGCDMVLMACCTASSVYEFLSEERRCVSLPIISPTAKSAVTVSKTKRIGILSTEATRKSRSFVEKIMKYEPMASCFCHHAPELVSLAEAGERDGVLTSYGLDTVEKCVSIFRSSGIDTLILGCTHFAYFENTIKEILKVNVVNSAREGALLVQKYASAGEGKTFFLK